MKWIVFALVLHTVYTVSTTPATTAKPKKFSKFEQKILDEVAKFKTQMKTGLPEAKIPPMEPFNVPNQDLSSLSLGNLVTIKVAKVKNCQVVGLSDFSIDHIKLNIMMMKVNINMSFPHVNVQGQYDIDGKAIGLIPVYGRGSFDASVYKTHVSSTAVLGTKNKKMQIESLSLHAEIDDLKLSMEGLLGGGSLGDEINNMLQKVVSKLARNMVPKLASKMSDFARQSINAALANMDVGGLVG